MYIFIWKHSKTFSSWSMIDEPHIHSNNYHEADVAVLAASKKEALFLLQEEGGWNIEELETMEPDKISLAKPKVLYRHLV